MGEIGLNRDQILNILPHRDTALLIDSATIHDYGELSAGRGNHVITQEDCLGHFPDHPVFPGIKYVEALAQLAGLVALQHPEIQNLGNNALPVFVKVGNCTFRKSTKPGDTLLLSVNLIELKIKRGWIVADGSVYDKDVCVATVSGMNLAMIKKEE